MGGRRVCDNHRFPGRFPIPMRPFRPIAALLAAALLVLAPSFASAQREALATPSSSTGPVQHAAFNEKLGPPIPVSEIRKVTEVEGITEYRLPNGLKVLLFPDASKPTITVNITYLVGSRFENYGETGMAHLLEHLLFKGTPRHPHMDEEFNVRGARFNGSTWLEIGRAHV